MALPCLANRPGQKVENLSSHRFLAIFFAGASLAHPERADGPSMQETEQYLTDNLASNYYEIPPNGSLQIDDYNFVASQCQITFSQTSNPVATGIDPINFTIPMNKVSFAGTNSFPDHLDLTIYAWNSLDLFTASSHDGSQMTQSWVSVSLSPDAFTVDKRLINAIEHYASLCGSVGPSKATSDPNDPFSN